MVMREIERRRRFQVEGRYQLDAAATRDQFLMLGSAVLPLRGITGEQDDDSVEIRMAKAVHLIVGWFSPRRPRISARATMPA